MKKAKLFLTITLLFSFITCFSQLKVWEDGEVSIGTYFPNQNNADLKLETFKKPAIHVYTRHTRDWQQSIICELDRPNSVTYVVNYGNSDNFYVKGTGLAVSKSGFYVPDPLGGTKSEIEDIVTPLKKTLQLEGIKYKVDSEENGSHYKFGFDVEVLEQTFPEVVETVKDGEKAVSYSQLVPVLVEAIKEQQEQIDELRKLLDADIKLSGDNTITTEPMSKLYQNMPNPFNEKTEIKFYIDESVNNAHLYIYNLQGIQLLKYPITDRGESYINFSGSTLQAGIYHYALFVDGKEVDTKKMILTK